MPDYPDDWPHDVDYSRFEGRGLTRGWYQYYCNPIGEDGLTLTSRRWKEQGEKLDKEIDEQTQREIDNMPLLGINVPEFPGEETIEERVRRMKMEDEVKKKALDGPSKSSNSNEKALATNGPATIKSRKAAAILSQSTASGTAPARKPLTTATKARMPFSLLGGKKKTPPPTNPSPMRHTAAVTASRTTMGYSKGRATSSTIRKSILPKNKASTGASAEVPDTTLAPAVYIQKYGEPPVGSDMWIRCAQLGCFKDDDDNLDDVLKSTLPASLLVDEEDEEEFQFVC